MNTMLILAALWGALIAGGCVALVGGTRRTVPRLDDAIAMVEGRHVDRRSVMQRLPFSAEATRLLAVRNEDMAGHLKRKLTGAIAGALAPSILSGVMVMAFGWSPAIPLVVAVAGVAWGFIAPDIDVVRGNRAAREDAREALFTYFDLVTLERLGNLSTSQALASAAEVSDMWLFVRIREALNRARLQQRAPWVELTALADELDIEELADIADIMRLDETGAALSGTLRARVRELRDAHLTQVKVAAHAVSESMTIAMAIPTVIFGLIFIVPPILRLLS